MAHFISQSEENYLKTLYKLTNKKTRKVNNIALAKALDLNPATVLEMIRKLSLRNLVRTLPDKTIELTETGRKTALLTIRKHRLWEVFLVDKLNYKWNEVHDLAEQLEHIQSDDLIDRLEKYLDFPAVDPHGDPIPDKKGRVKNNPSIPLTAATPGKFYIIKSLAETSDTFLDYLNKINLQLGTLVRIDSINDYDGSLEVTLGKKKLLLTDKTAVNILVQMPA